MTTAVATSMTTTSHRWVWVLLWSNAFLSIIESCGALSSYRYIEISATGLSYLILVCLVAHVANMIGCVRLGESGIKGVRLAAVLAVLPMVVFLTQMGSIQMDSKRIAVLLVMLLPLLVSGCLGYYLNTRRMDRLVNAGQVWKGIVLMIAVLGSVWLSIFLTYILLFALLWVGCLLFSHSSRSKDLRSLRVMIMISVSFACCFMGLRMNVEESPHGNSYWQASRQQHELWLEQHSASNEHYPTFIVAGWPVQEVEGNGQGHSSERLPWGKGLDALFLNLGFWAVFGGLLAWTIPRVALRLAALPVLVSCTLFQFYGLSILNWMLD